MAGLCQQYWYPIYVFVRRRCGDLHHAEDLTQSFFERVLTKQTFRAADPTKGRFRSFLLTSVSHFIANEYASDRTQRRGGMAPEQMATSKSVDHRADIYSLGVVFYELLTGETPMGWFQPPSKKVAVDVRLDEVVLRTLESEPERRYQNASEVKTAIENLSSSVAVNPSTEPIGDSSTGKSVRLHKLLDATESHYRRLHSWSTVFGVGVLPVVGMICFPVLPLAAFAVWAAALVTIIYSVRIKKHQVFEAKYKGHTIRLDNSGTFAERLYLDDGLVQSGGIGTKMEFRFPIKAGEGIGDEIIVWFDAGFSKTRCRIEVESRG